MVKKKKSGITPEKQASGCSLGSHQSADLSQESTETEQSSSSSQKIAPFKNAQFMSTRSGQSSKKSRGWKNLKQILVSEKQQSGVVSYASLDAGPSKKPSKKYSDISGLLAKYKDPTTKLLYHNSDEFASIRMLSSDVITGYLDLRKANQ